MTTTQTTNDAIAAAVMPVAEEIAMTRLSQIDEPLRQFINGPRSWYVIAKKGDNEAEIRIYEDIGTFGVTAKQFADDLERVRAERVHVRLNTDGGEAFNAIAIFNALKAHSGKVIVHIDGIAASAGSVIALAGDEIRMANNAFLMIHEARGGVMGEAGDMRDYAAMLDKLNDAIASIYQGRAGRTRQYWRDKMAEESWFTAEEAKSEGLIDIIEEPNKAAKNRFDFAPMNHVPEAARKQWGKPEECCEVCGDPGKPFTEAIFAGEKDGWAQYRPGATHIYCEKHKTENKPDAAPAAAANVETQPDNQQQTAPVTSPSGDTAPAIPQQENVTMSDTNAPAAPAPTSAPVAITDDHTIQQIVTQARADERQKAQQEVMDRFNAICAASPDDFEMIVSAFKTGQSPEAVKMAFEKIGQERARAKEAAEVKDREIHRLQLLASYGGYSGGVVTSFNAEGQEQVSVDPKAQADAEWARNHDNCRAKFSKKENYVIVRTKELEGRFTMSVASES